uniref:Uncharacterized protein n=1 Tax=Sipha flava TaxID=143950 RepID=A0A2S2Q624_9HEMI
MRLQTRCTTRSCVDGGRFDSGWVVSFRHRFSKRTTGNKTNNSEPVQRTMPVQTHGDCILYKTIEHTYKYIIFVGTHACTLYERDYPVVSRTIDHHICIQRTTKAVDIRR